MCKYLTKTVKTAQNDGRWLKVFKSTLGKTTGVSDPTPPPMNPCK